MLDIECDAYVSPANSYGIMDGGIDYVLRMRFIGIESAVHEAIAERGGSLRVGEAVVVETDDLEIPYLICAPTMEVPSDVAQTRNAYLAMNALLRPVNTYNDEYPDSIATAAVPGLCTGIGGMNPMESVAQMAQAYADWVALAD